MALSDVLSELDLSLEEAESLLREAKITRRSEDLTAPDLARIDVALQRLTSRLAGRDYRSPDGADRQQATEIGPFDLFHRQTGQHIVLKSFGDLVRWSESEYGWK